MRAIILAGGFGTRLRSRVTNTPKPMAPIAGRPFLEFVLDQLVRDGFKRVTLSVGHLHTLISDHFGSAYRGIEIGYAIESTPLGTGGALLHAFGSLGRSSDPVVVLNGDTYLDIDYRRFLAWFEEKSPDVAMVLRPMEDAGRYGQVEVADDRVIRFCEKGTGQKGLINAGVYAMRPDTLIRQQLPVAFSLEREFFEARLSNLHIAPYSADAYFIDIGVPDDFDRAQLELPVRSGAGAVAR